MEIFQLNYFSVVAKHESIHAASRETGTSPASLSKAVSALESELGVPLFRRVKRKIELTAQGRALQVHALDILDREAAARFELSGQRGMLTVVMAGQEILFSKALPMMTAKLRQRHSDLSQIILNRDAEATIQSVERGESHIGLVTGEVPKHLARRQLFHSSFQTCVGKGHSLYRQAKAATSIPVAEVLKHNFASINQAILGSVGPRQSPDGWRDDKFPRRVSHRVDSLRVLEALVTSGEAIAYLPDYYANQIGVAALNITGCPYHCEHDVFMVARRPELHGWLNMLFS